jgi:hypothetical protein
MHRQIAIFIAGEVQRLNAVPLADVPAEVNELLQGGIANVPVAADFVIGYLDGNGLIVIVGVRACPCPILFLNVHPDSAVCPDAVIRAGLSGSGSKDVPTGFNGQISRHVMDSDFLDGISPGIGTVWGNFRVVYQRTVTHGFVPPSF